MSRRSLLRASAWAGVGATGLALVGCGDDDGQQTVAQAQQQEQQVMQQQAEQQPQQQQAQQQQEQATVADALAKEAECSVPWPLDQVDLDASILTARDVVFSYDRMAGKAAYQQGGETTDHRGGWTSNATARGSANWVRNEAVDDRTWAFELPAPDAGFFTVNLMGVPAVAIISQADVEGRGDLAVDQSPMGAGPYRFVSHTDDESFVYERASRTTSVRSTTPSGCRTTLTTNA